MTTTLRIEVDRALHEPVQLTFDVPPADFELTDDPEFEFHDPVVGDITAKKVGADSLLVSGTVRTVASAGCVRCLHALRLPVNLSVNLIFTREPADPREMEGDDETNFFTGEYIYPAERLREELILALPHLPACELEDSNFCPIRQERIPPMSFGAEEAPAPEPEPANAPQDAAKSATKNASWQSQLANVRKRLEDGQGA
ncbi:MAG: YceD family protein [Sumerlaeia bacterium]